MLVKKTYFESELESKQTDPKAGWKVLNESLNRSSSKLRDIKIYGESYSEPVEIANSFSTFFSEIESEVRSDIPDSTFLRTLTYRGLIYF